MPGRRFEPVEMIERLVGFDTTSRESNLALIDFVAGYLEDHGVASTLMHDPSGTKANLFASLGPEAAPGVVLSGHTDVVPVDGQDWSSDPFRLSERDGRLYGRGSADMKSFIGIALALVPEFLARGLRVPLQLALSYDEEVGCLGAPALAAHIKGLPARPRLVIVGEPTGMRVVNAHKGIRSFETAVTGLEAHSSATDKGVSAILIAGRLVAELDRLAGEMRARAAPATGFDPPYTTVSVGLIEGGTATNIIPKSCRFAWEYRLMPGADPDEIIERFRAFAERLLPAMRAVERSVGIETQERVRVPGLRAEPGSDAESFAMALAETNATGVVSFGTEAGIFQAAGVPAMICGPGEISVAHKADEYIERSQIDACVAFMRRLMDRLAAD